MEKSKKRLKDPKGKQRSHITKFIVQSKSRQEFLPLLGKYVDLLKAEPLHHTSFASRLTTKGRPCVVSHTWRFRHLKTARRGELSGRSETVVASLRWVWFVSCITTETAAENQFCQALFVYYILIWIHMAWIKVLLLAFCHFDRGTSEDQLSFKGVSYETSHFGICCSQIQRCSFYLLKSWGAHWASRKLKTSCQHTPRSLTSEAWVSIQCMVERQSMLSWLSMWKTNAMPKRA